MYPSNGNTRQVCCYKVNTLSANDSCFGTIKLSFPLYVKSEMHSVD